MATWDITVSAGSNVGSGTDVVLTNLTGGNAPPGDFDGGTITDVSVVGTPTITTNNGPTDDSVEIRIFITNDAGTDVYGSDNSSNTTACGATLGASASSANITDGLAPFPAPTTAVAADWDDVRYSINYTANMKDDGETIDWSSFTLRVTYTPGATQVNPSMTGTGSVSLTKEVRKALNVSGTGTFVNYIRPRVWLNSTQTKSGADEMTVTAYNLAGTSITFTDPAGGQTGSLQLGVEKLKTGDLGWIAVTVNAGGVTQKTLPYTGTGTATLSKEVQKSLSPSGVGTPTVAKAVSKDTFSSTGTGTSTVAKQVGKATFASTGTGTADLTNQIGKPLSYSGTGSSAVTKAVTKDTFSTTGTGTSSVLKAVDKAAFAITAVGTAALSKTKVTLKTLTFTGTGTSTVAKQVGKPLSMSGTGSSAFSKLASYVKTLSFTGTGSSSVTKQVGLDTKSFSGVGTASESHIKTKLRSYSYSGVGTASLTKVVQYARSFSASGVGSVGINREMGYTFAYSGVGTPTYSDITQFKRSLSFTGVGTSAPVDVETGIEINPSMTGTGTSTLGRAIQVIKGIFGIGTASLSHDGDAGDPGWMDGVMTEEEWWARRRKMKRRMMKIMGVKRLSK